jgi:hypothetical protein
VRAALLGAAIVEIPVRERGRCAGTQKVSHVSMRRTLSVGMAIVAAGIRTRWRMRAQAQGASAPPSIPVGGLNAGSVTGVMGVSKS